MATLTEVFPCFFLRCKANARLKPQRRGTARALTNFCVVLCTVCVYMCTVLLPPDGYPIAVKYITYHIIIVCIPICLLPINPTPRPYLRVTWIRTLGHVVGGNRCGGDTLLRVITTRWLTGLSSGQAKMEGVVLKAAWHWGSDSSVINNTPGEPGCTHCM